MGDDMSPGCHASPCERQEAHTLPNVLYLLWAATTSYEDAKLDCRTRPDQTRAAIQLACDGHAADGRESCKTVRMCADRM